MNIKKSNKKYGLFLLLTIFVIAVLITGCGDSSGNETAQLDYQLSLISADTHGAKYTFSFSINNLSVADGINDITWNVYVSDDTIYDSGDTGIYVSRTTPALDSPGITTFNLYGMLAPEPRNFYLIIFISSPDDTDSTNDSVVSAQLSIAPLFEEDFEDQDISDWTQGAPSNYTISFPAVSGLTGGTSAAGSTYCLGMVDTSGISNFDGIYTNLGTVMPNYIKFYTRMDSPSGTYNSFALGTASDFSNTMIDTTIVDELAGLNGYGPPNISSYTINADEWYQVEINDIDWDNHTVDLYINSTLVEDDFPFRNTGSSVSYLNIFNWSLTNISYIDDIEIY